MIKSYPTYRVVRVVGRRKKGKMRLTFQKNEVEVEEDIEVEIEVEIEVVIDVENLYWNM